MAVRHMGSKLRRSRDLDSLDEPFDLVVAQWNIIVVEPAHTRRPGVLFTVEKDTPVKRLAHAEPLACCVRGQKQTPVSLKDTVLIVGAGPIGQGGREPDGYPSLSPHGGQRRIAFDGQR